MKIAYRVAAFSLGHPSGIRCHPAQFIRETLHHHDLSGNGLILVILDHQESGAVRSYVVV
jgi:hypothetical protein